MKQKRAKREPKWRPKCIQNAQKEPKESQRGTKRRKRLEKRHAKNDAKFRYRKKNQNGGFHRFWFDFLAMPGGKGGADT